MTILSESLPADQVGFVGWRICLILEGCGDLDNDRRATIACRESLWRLLPGAEIHVDAANGEMEGHLTFPPGTTGELLAIVASRLEAAVYNLKLA